MVRNCIVCGKEFRTSPSYLKKGSKIKFCSQNCRIIAIKKKIVIPGNPFKKGEHFSPETEIKQGQKRPEILRELHPNWKGGQVKNRGYVFILKPEHHRANMGKGYVKRAALVAEEKIGRKLYPKEAVHHINGIKDDDRPENLMVFLNNYEHLKFERSHNWAK